METEDEVKTVQHPKSILKVPSPGRKLIGVEKKTAKFDETNILATLPQSKVDAFSNIPHDTPFDVDKANIDIDELHEKLRLAANAQTPSFGDENLSDDEFPETEEEKINRLEFERRRKAHYNEYFAVNIARKLIEDELIGMEDDDDVEDISLEISHIENSSCIEFETEVANSFSTDRKSGDVDEPGSAGSEQSASDLGDIPQTDIDVIVPPSHPCYGKIKKP